MSLRTLNKFVWLLRNWTPKMSFNYFKSIKVLKSVDKNLSIRNARAKF